MKKLKILLLVLVLAIGIRINTEAADNKLTILFTHDLHDHIDPYSVIVDGKAVDTGGYQRLAHRIKSEREIDPELLLIDGGDYSMGTLYQTIYAKDIPTLRLFGYMGYDATTFGNHEFDFKSSGLSSALRSALKSGDALPEIVSSNIGFDVESKSDSLIDLENSFKEFGVKDYTVIEKNGYKIGLFGILGDDAVYDSPTAEVAFADPIESAKRVVKILREEEKVDMVVALSHSGTEDDPKKSEDEIMAKEVPGIDFILSGHTHTTLSEPKVIGNTVIGSTGDYGKNLGKAVFSRSGDSWILDSYELLPLTGDYEVDPILEEKIEYLKSEIQSEYLDNFNVNINDSIAYSPFDFTPYSDLGDTQSEYTLTNLFTDSYVYAVKKAEGEDYTPITAAIIPNGTVRDSFVKGPLTISDVFNANSLGIGPDEISGYPLISVYLTGKDLKTAAEVDASVTPIMRVAQLYMSGVSYSFNPNRLIFNKLTDFYIVGEDGSRVEVVDDELYRVVTGLYTAQMLTVVKDQSFGLLSIIPRDVDGNPIENFEEHIIYDEGHEVKEWFAVAEYLQSFPVEDGLPTIPDYYNELQGRKIVEDDRGLFAFFASPNTLALGVYGIVLLIILLLVLLIRFIIKRRKKKSEKENN